MKQEPVAPFSHAVVGQSPPDKQRPRIRLSRNGPYLVTVDDLTNSKGERLQGGTASRCVAAARRTGSRFVTAPIFESGFRTTRARTARLAGSWTIGAPPNPDPAT